MQFSGIALAAFLGAFAWLYQRAWERQELRRASYQNVLDRLPAFTVENLDPDQITEVLTEMRRMLLYAPDEVVKAAEAFLESIEAAEPDVEKHRKLSCLTLEMRKDCTFLAAISPSFFRTRLKSTALPLKKAANHKIANK